MPISVVCPSCDSRIRAPEHAAGRKATCPDCGQSLTVPSTGAQLARNGAKPAAVPDTGEVAAHASQEALPLPAGGWLTEDGQRVEPASLQVLQGLTAPGNTAPDDSEPRDAPAVPREVPEEVFLKERGVTVTTTRLVVPGQTYTLRAATSVRLFRDGPERLGGILVLLGLWVLGALLLLVVGLAVVSIPAIVLGLVLLVPAVALTGALITGRVARRTRQGVVVTFASGEKRTLVARDDDHRQRLYDALCDAIAARD